MSDVVKVEDIAALDPCTRANGLHRLAVLVSDDWITGLCVNCGMARRMPMNGPLQIEGPLDDMTVDEIERRIYGRTK